MRDKLLYVLLACGVAVLVVAAVFLTRSLLDLANEPPAKPSKKVPAATAKQQIPPDASGDKAQPAPAGQEVVLDGPGSVEIAAKAGAPAEPAAAAAPAAPDPQPAQPAVEKNATPEKKAASQPAGQEGIGEVELIRGSVFAVSATEQRRALSATARVFMNERIQTGAGAKIKIKFNDGSTVWQGENSELVIDKYLYNADKTADCAFAMRFLKGVCRVVTGLIVSANPAGFEVRTKMASVGIRGCDLAFKSMADRDNVYVFEMGAAKGVTVHTTSDGSQVMNMLTGAQLPVNAALKKSLDVNESQTVVCMARGKAPEQRRIGPEEARDLVGETSYKEPARYDVKQRPDGADMTLQPVRQKSKEPSQEERNRKNEK